jgi:hypothetical protein
MDVAIFFVAAFAMGLAAALGIYAVTRPKGDE